MRNPRDRELLRERPLPFGVASFPRREAVRRDGLRRPLPRVGLISLLQKTLEGFRRATGSTWRGTSQRQREDVPRVRVLRNQNVTVAVRLLRPPAQVYRVQQPIAPGTLGNDPAFRLGSRRENLSQVLHAARLFRTPLIHGHTQELTSLLLGERPVGLAHVGSEGAHADRTQGATRLLELCYRYRGNR